jgi:hypothetical protein
VLLLHDVPGGNQTGQQTVFVDERQLLDLSIDHQLLGLLESDGSLMDYELLSRRHPVGDLLSAADEPHVARRQQPFQLARAVDDHERADARALHRADGLRKARLRRDGVWVGNHAMLRAFDNLHFADLRGDVAAAEAAVDDADAAFLGLDDRHGRARNRVHIRRHDRMLQDEVLGKARRQINRLRIAALEHAEFRREEEVVEGAAPDGFEQVGHADIIIAPRVMIKRCSPAAFALPHTRSASSCSLRLFRARRRPRARR